MARTVETLHDFREISLQALPERDLPPLGGPLPASLQQCRDVVIYACFLAESAGSSKRRVAAAGRHVQDLLGGP